MTTGEILSLAKTAKQSIMSADTDTKNKALLYMAEEIVAATEEILEANSEDVQSQLGIISDVMIDRLKLTKERIVAMAEGIKDVVSLPDPVGEIKESVTRENGLVINRVAVPVGVIGIIYESRPNVTSDAAALAIKSGNACVLRCGKEAHRSAKAIVKAIKKALMRADINENAVCLIEDTTRQSATEMMMATGYIDLLMPRGGKGLIDSCVKNAKVPCIQTGTGICHVYVDKDADVKMALDIVNNAKTSRPSVCNAEEVLLVHKDIAKDFLPKIKEMLVDERIECGKQAVELRLCEKSADIIEGTKATDEDFDTEFLDYILAVKIVDSVKDAVTHITAHSTGHSEAIVSCNETATDYFVKNIDSAAVYVNASTRFTDGGEFGLGCEMGISTQKLHARGPIGLRELCSYKYVVKGTGQIR